MPKGKFLGYWLVLCLLAFAGCSSQYPNKMIQVCLRDRENVLEFKRVLGLFAERNRASFIDKSQETDRELRALKVHPGYDLIYVGLKGRTDRIGLEGGNLGLSAYEVALGFSRSESPEAQVFADELIRELGMRWEVHVVPDGQGAFPLPNCSGNDSR